MARTRQTQMRLDDETLRNLDAIADHLQRTAGATNSLPTAVRFAARRAVIELGLQPDSAPRNRDPRRKSLAGNGLGGKKKLGKNR